MSFNLHLSTTPDDEKQLASTPWEIIKAVEQALNLRVLLDVCALPESRKAPYFIGARDFKDACQVGVDMYKNNWADLLRNLSVLDADYVYPGRVQAAYMNPQFDQFEEAMTHAALNAARGAWVVTLCKHDESTDYWQKIIRKRATFIVKPKRRISFVKPDGSPFMKVNKKTGKLEKTSPPFFSVLPIFTPIPVSGPPMEIWL